MQLRSFFKPAGTNPEVEGPFYELSSYVIIEGHSNFEAITIGFSKGLSFSEMKFRPIDLTKPIVLAVRDSTDIGFIYIDQHLQEGADAGMCNYKAYKTDKFIIDCQPKDTAQDKREYWSVHDEGLTFIYGKVTFPDTWQLRNCDLLCAFIGGELTVNQLRMHAYLADREAVKEERREAHIQRLSEIASVASAARDELVCKLKSDMNGLLPFVCKDKILKVIEENA